jgi:DNA mismatch repair protein MutS2
MRSELSAELDLENVIDLVAAHARSSVGRTLLHQSTDLPSIDEAHRNASLTAQISELIAEFETLSFAAVDDALPWLESGRLSAVLPEELLCLYSLARRIAAIRRTLGNAPPHFDLLVECRNNLPDLDELVRWAGGKIGRDGQVPDSASPELGRLRKLAAGLRIEIVAQLEAIKRAHPKNTVDAPPTLRRDRYCLPVRAGAQ